MTKVTRGKTSTIIVQQARALRHEQTLAEKRLWSAIRNRQLAGLKFRRQHPYGRFILDLFCVEHQLAVEVDGGIHLTPEQAAHDADRSEYLALHGIRVVRFTNEEIERNLPDVLRKIIKAAASPLQTTAREASSSGEGPGVRRA
jgi:very-short-patch-repair endonuclease